MSKQVFIGNISYQATDDDLRNLFEEQGVPVLNARILMQENKSRGFGFVTIGDTMEPGQAIEKMNGQKLLGRTIRVEHATPAKRPARG